MPTEQVPPVLWALTLVGGFLVGFLTSPDFDEARAKVREFISAQLRP